ncbi:hypothetical protein IA539_13030 [Gordonia sp. zg691]|uniref:hypothetical protein n=1 Tax=Gordonia jinghuaiqii TaxID=2758710 RepID=UPI0016628360|nr:hypothetical protein [Gordonia jinghuaiqii]MBD0862132.1 hypothetical protein [Gordonia jinghuaiqii]
MKFAVYGLAATVAVSLAAFGAGGASAAPSSVQRDGGPCYVHEYGKDSADGQLYCSGLRSSWTSKALSRAPKVNIGDQCPQLGTRAYVDRTDGVATCRQANDGRLRWQW